MTEIGVIGSDFMFIYQEYTRLLNFYMLFRVFFFLQILEKFRICEK